MSSELPQTPDWQIQEERLQYGAEIVVPNKATGDLRSFFETEKMEIDAQPNHLIWGDNLLVMQALLVQEYEGQIELEQYIYAS